MDIYKFGDCLLDELCLGFDKRSGTVGYFVNDSFIPFAGYKKDDIPSALDTLYEISCYTKTHSATNKTTNCPNCGAPITSNKCEYCGTNFEASAIWGMEM